MFQSKSLNRPGVIALQNLPPFKILAALLAIYLIWGSTYLAITYAIESMPPFMMASLRFLIAGTLLFTFLVLRGEAIPTRRQWRNAAIIGVLLAGIGQGGVTFAEQWVTSGLTALAVATIPLWSAVFNSFFERKPTRPEGVGLAMGMVGVIVLNLGSDLWAEPAGAIALIIAPMSWAFGSMWSRKLDLPDGLMASATMMLVASFPMGLVSILRGEQITGTVHLDSLLAFGYLIIFGSIFAFSTYQYLLKNAQAMVATSYAYVNPVIAVFLGWLIVNEKLTLQTFVA
ncbi:MAG TPA: drug/metabolite exporter YedA, partial [Aggregatilineales bacterium]|nr:drug/metabolite exporter YedA [Aggregatilineales bacterium]